MHRKIQRFGYRPDLGDPRDHVFTAPAGLTIPQSVDLRPKFPAPWDQGQLGSCTAFAITGMMAFMHGFEGSQLWLYYEERAMEHDTRSDAGAQIRDGIKVLANQGLPVEADWPYDVALFAHKPPAKATADAKTNLVKEYQRLTGADNYRACLAAGFPFVVGISVFESFESDAVAKSGDVPMPAKHEKLLGGHALCVVGYETDGRYIVRNSWGTDWGLGGYFHLPAAYLASNDLATDAWTIR